MPEALAGEFAEVLVKSLRALGDAGETEQACRLAARAWSHAHTVGHPSAAKFDGLLHYLTRPPERNPSPCPTTAFSTSAKSRRFADTS